MKIQLHNSNGSVLSHGARVWMPSRGSAPQQHEVQRDALRLTKPWPAQRRSESGMATVLFIALLAIMMVLVMVESRSIIRLHQEVKLLEKQQIKRLNSPATNAVSTVSTP